MPQPPNFDPLDEVKFVTNYLLAGCVPPYDLFVEFSQAPAQDLLMLILLPDLVDIGQSIFEPKKGRRRKPARHGRKKRRFIGIPDTSDLIGQKARSQLNPHDAFNFGPLRKAFRIVNKYEGVAFSAALLDGITSIAYETCWGILKVDPDHCTDFSRLSRTKDTSQLAGGAGPPIWPISLPTIEFSSGFNSTPFAATSFTGKWTLSVKMTLLNGGGLEDVYGQLAIGEIGGDIIAESHVAHLAPGSTATLDVNAEIEAGQWIEWGISSRRNNPVVIGGACLAYVQEEFPWPW